MPGPESPTPRPFLDTPAARLESLRDRFGARAAGWWTLAGDRLELVTFAPAPDLAPDVTTGFTEATRSVPLTRSDLGVVRAAVTGAVAVSRLADSPEGSGSGLWLRRFGASRSVAVPVAGRSGKVAWVISVALADPSLADDEVAAILRAAAAAWGDPAPGTG